MRLSVLTVGGHVATGGWGSSAGFIKAFIKAIDMVRLKAKTGEADIQKNE